MKQTPSLTQRLLTHCGLSAIGAYACVVLLTVAPVSLRAQIQPKAPSGKIYVAGLEGGAQIFTGDKIEALTLKSVYVAQRTAIETNPHGTLAMVFSNGTGISLDPETHIDVKRFTQEPFVASRTDLELEPSVSQTEVFVAHGTLAVSTSKLAAGSVMTYLTPLGSINLHGGKVVIEMEGGLSKISVLEGEGTVRGGEVDLGGKVIHAGEQAISRPGPPGEPNIVIIEKIPAGELAMLEEKDDLAYQARKTVFFETDGTGEITVVPVVPASVPVQATISPAKLPN